VSIDDCERASREIEREIEAAGLIQDAFDLQVSSPGVERPIVTDDDIRRNTGRRVLVETRERILGVTAFRGVLRGLEGDALKLEGDSGEGIPIPRSLLVLARQDFEADLRAPGKGPRSPGKRDRRGIVGGSSS